MAFVDRTPASGFIATDRAALAAAFELEVVHYDRRPTIRYVVDAVVRAWRCDATYTYFASEHALIPALVSWVRGRPFVLATGGYDFANVPQRRYGLAARRRSWLPKVVARISDTILCASNASRDEVLALVPPAGAKAKVAYLGADSARWAPADVERDPSRVVTVGYVSPASWSRKGIDRFVAAAGADPDREYVLAGQISQDVRPALSAPLPVNLRVTGFLEHDALNRLLWSAGVYAQLSWHEAFGMSMLEAMLCGCVPVITPIPALREVAGDWAVETTSPTDDVAAIRRAAAREIDREALRSDAAARFPATARDSTVQTAVLAALARRRRPLSLGR